ncbi:hypothetical protein [Sicyoidochytrium minutum DNA virus]|nr:hypothetical protein [Sicyoidochytrium minutum DNA virus]
MSNNNAPQRTKNMQNANVPESAMSCTHMSALGGRLFLVTR